MLSESVAFKFYVKCPSKISCRKFVFQNLVRYAHAATNNRNGNRHLRPRSSCNTGLVRAAAAGGATEMAQSQPQPAAQQAISEATAIRLFNSVVASGITPQVEANNNNSCSGQQGTDISSRTATTSSPLGLILPASRQSSQDSVHSANESGNSCRICRWNRSDMEIIKCPCKCKGSVGFIHLKCLKRWIMHRRDNRCEICHAIFEISEDRVSLKQMMRTFCCGRCCGLIVKHLLFSASLMPLAHIILQQVLQCMDNLNQGSTEQLTVQEVFVASCALLTSSALFFHFFEFVTTRCLLIRNILRHWWLFGSTSDFALVEIDDDSVDLF